jgi:hypothetical protein
MWYCIPGIITFIYQENTPFTPFYFLQGNVSRTSWLSDYILTYTLESFAVIIVLLIIIKTYSKSRYFLRKESEIFSAHTIGDKWKIVITVLCFLLLLYQAFNFRGDYLENNNTELYGSADTLSQIINFSKSFFYSMNILIFIKEKQDKTILRFAFGLILFDSILSALRGFRLAILSGIFVYLLKKIYYAYHFGERQENNYSNNKNTKGISNRNKIIIAIIASFVFTWFVFLPIAQSIGQVRGAGNINLLEAVVNSFTKQSNVSDTHEVNNLEDVETIFGKLDSFTGGSMIANVVGYGQGGVTPYIGSFLVFVPRFLVPEKPIAGTSDGTIYTHPSRLVPSSVGVKSESLNIPISPLHISFWQFGYIGFPIFIFCLNIYLRWIISLFNSNSFIYQSIGMLTITFPTFSNVFVSPDVMLKNFCVMLPIILSIELLKKTRSRYIKFMS